ncbi:MAG: hypothetical protein J3K34DRAFT_413399 [Monoraphidium minutum]|nr:MAG: hypothetical protein J3K34DRAFT_413399 [Monoraphidium minutum]
MRLRTGPRAPPSRAQPSHVPQISTWCSRLQCRASSSTSHSSSCCGRERRSRAVRPPGRAMASTSTDTQPATKRSRRAVRRASAWLSGRDGSALPCSPRCVRPVSADSDATRAASSSSGPPATAMPGPARRPTPPAAAAPATLSCSDRSPVRSATWGSADAGRRGRWLGSSSVASCGSAARSPHAAGSAGSAPRCSSSAHAGGKRRRRGRGGRRGPAAPLQPASASRPPPAATPSPHPPRSLRAAWGPRPSPGGHGTPGSIARRRRSAAAVGARACASLGGGLSMRCCSRRSV